MNEKGFFPKPNEVLTLPTPIFHAANEVKDLILNHNFNFKPSYQVSRYFNEIGQLLKESGWSLKLENEKWVITPGV